MHPKHPWDVIGAVRADAQAVAKDAQVAVKADAQVLAIPVVMVVVKQLVQLIVRAVAISDKFFSAYKWILS